MIWAILILVGTPGTLWLMFSAQEQVSVMDILAGIFLGWFIFPLVCVGGVFLWAKETNVRGSK